MSTKIIMYVFMPLAVIAILVAFCIPGCEQQKAEQENPKFNVYSDSGVNVYIERIRTPKTFTIQNNNDFAVRIRFIDTWSNYGEVTQWIKVLQPEEKKNFTYELYIDARNGFYISDMQGVQIGFIKLNSEFLQK